jgi:hypothetical protein
LLSREIKAPGLDATLTPDSLTKLFDAMSEEEKKEIIEHLPEGQKTEEGLRENLLSPQLTQAMQSLTQAIQQSGENVQMIMAMCDLDSSTFDDTKDGMEALIKAFVKKYSKRD